MAQPRDFLAEATSQSPLTQSEAERQAPPFDYLRVSVTMRCQLRCVYCHSRTTAEMAPAAELPAAERAAGCAALCAVALIRKIRLMGGEPLLREDLPALIAALAALPQKPEITLTTNGLRLAEWAAELAVCGLLRVNVSLDSPNVSRYRWLTGRDALHAVLRGLAAARAAGLALKINTVALASLSVAEIRSLLAIAADYEAPLRFIELMPLGLSQAFYREAFIPATEIRRRLAAPVEGRLEPLEEADGGQRVVTFSALSFRAACRGSGDYCACLAAVLSCLPAASSFLRWGAAALSLDNNTPAGATGRWLLARGRKIVKASLSTCAAKKASGRAL